MLTFQFDGNMGLYFKWTGDILDSAKGLSASVLKPPSGQYVRFDTGTAYLTVNTVLTEATSSYTFIVKGLEICSGTLAGGDATGIAFISAPSGTLTSGRSCSIGGNAACTIRSSNIEFGYEGLVPRSILVSVASNSLRFTCDDVHLPTTSTGTPASFGHVLPAVSSLTVRGVNNVRNFRLINAVAASNGEADISVFY